LLDLARSSRGWSRAQLARALGRDPTKVYPESGNPKADFLVRLAEALEWPVGEVIETIWNGSTAPKSGGEGEDYRDLYHRARESHSTGRYQDVVDLAHRMYEVAGGEERRAFACAMEYSGWDGLGRYLQGVEALRRGLRHGPIRPTTRNILRADLANAWYSLWDLTPALGTAEMLVDLYEARPPEERVDWKRVAFCLYVRGHTRRRLMAVEPELAEDHARAAIEDLGRSARLYRELSDDLEDPSLAGIANTSDGGVMEVEASLGLRSGEEVVGLMLEAIEDVDAEQELIVGDWLESYGWWCVFGSNVALRTLGGSELQRSVRRFTDRALAIAERLDNWAMRERAYTLQYSMHRTLAESSGLEMDFTIAAQDRGKITATMGRFPSFREVGWDILDTAKVVGSN
jgi:hypothetical protein